MTYPVRLSTALTEPPQTNLLRKESAFYMTGSIDDARAKGEKILAELSKKD